MQGQLHRWHGFQHTTSWAIQALGQNLRYAATTAQGMMTRNPNNACETRATEATMIAKDATSVLKGLAQRCSEMPCTTLVSQSIFER
jgi:hypothetical protein